MADHRPRYATTVAGAVTVAVVGVGVAMAPVASEPPEEQISAPDVPLAEVNLDNVIPRRVPFCDNISDDAVTTAVEGSAKESAYVNGERATLEPGLTDIAHEFGCVFTRGQTVARVWVFAAPITRYDAEAMVRDASQDEGCTPTGPLRYGSPGLVMLCSDATTRMLRAVGRIGDAWVHCELSRPLSQADAKLSSRGQRWCVEAAYAMS